MPAKHFKNPTDPEVLNGNVQNSRLQKSSGV